MAKDVVITLHVDAKVLSHGNHNEQKILNHCTFSDNNNGGIPQGKGKKDFESVVFKNKKVIWEGKSNDQDYEIAITKIVQISGVNLFEKDPPFKGVGGNKAKVNQKLKNDSGVEGKEESYGIHFEIYKGEEFKNSLYIDPKLKMSAPSPTRAN